MKNIVLTLTIALCSLSVSNAAPVTFVDTFGSSGTRLLEAVAGSSFTIKGLSAGNESYLQSIWIESLSGDSEYFQSLALTLYGASTTDSTTYSDKLGTVGTSDPGVAVAGINGGGVTFNFGSSFNIENEEKYLFAFTNTDGTLGEDVIVGVTGSKVYDYGNAFNEQDSEAIGDVDIAMRITAFSPAAVPEPASLAFLGIGAAGFAIRRHRNRRSNVSLA